MSEQESYLGLNLWVTAFRNMQVWLQITVSQHESFHRSFTGNGLFFLPVTWNIQP